MLKSKRLQRKKLSDKYYAYHIKNKINDNVNALKYIEKLSNYLDQFNYYDDSNFIFCGRKKYLYDEIVRIVKKEQKEKDPIYFILGSLEEFMCDENKIVATDVEKDKWINGRIIDDKDFMELKNKNDLYTDSGYICKQEKAKITEIIKLIEKYILDSISSNNNEFQTINDITNKNIIPKTLSSDFYIKCSYISFQKNDISEKELEISTMQPVDVYYKAVVNSKIIVDKIMLVVNEVTSNSVKLIIHNQNNVVTERKTGDNASFNKFVLTLNDVLTFNLDDQDKGKILKISLIKHENDVDKYLKEIESEVDKKLIEQGLLKIEKGKKIPMFGSCQVRWKIEKNILKERYNIDWLTPAERNPYIMYD